MFWKALFNVLKVILGVLVFIILLPLVIVVLALILVLIVVRFICLGVDKLLHLFYSLVNKLYDYVISHLKTCCLLPFNLFLKIGFNLTISETTNKYSNLKENSFGKKQDLDFDNDYDYE